MAESFVPQLQEARHAIDLHGLHCWLTHELPDHLDALIGLLIGSNEADDLQACGDKDRFLSLIVGQGQEDFLDDHIQDVLLQFRCVPSDLLIDADQTA